MMWVSGRAERFLLARSAGLMDLTIVRRMVVRVVWGSS